jgi:hypothetical protein
MLTLDELKRQIDSRLAANGNDKADVMDWLAYFGVKKPGFRSKSAGLSE